MDIRWSHWLQLKNWTSMHKIQKWGCSDLVLGMPFNFLFRGSQVWYRTPWTSGLKTIFLFSWKPIDFHWKCQLQLWPWQKSNWSGWYMMVSSSAEVSRLMVKSSWSKNDRLCHIQIFQVWRSRSNLWHAIKELVIMNLGYKYQVRILTGYWFMGTCLSRWL